MEFVWRVHRDSAGSHIVVRSGHSGPWYYVRGPEHDREDRIRFHCCEEIARYLNRIARKSLPPATPPLWLGNLVRVDGNTLEDVDGTAILAVGPMFQRGPNDSQTSENIEHAEERRKLIDVLERAAGQASRIVAVAFKECG